MAASAVGDVGDRRVGYNNSNNNNNIYIAEGDTEVMLRTAQPGYASLHRSVNLGRWKDPRSGRHRIIIIITTTTAIIRAVVITINTMATTTTAGRGPRRGVSAIQPTNQSVSQSTHRGVVGYVSKPCVRLCYASGGGQPR